MKKVIKRIFKDDFFLLENSEKGFFFLLLEEILKIFSSMNELEKQKK